MSIRKTIEKTDNTRLTTNLVFHTVVFYKIKLPTDCYIGVIIRFVYHITTGLGRQCRHAFTLIVEKVHAMEWWIYVWMGSGRSNCTRETYDSAFSRSIDVHNVKPQNHMKCVQIAEDTEVMRFCMLVFSHQTTLVSFPNLTVASCSLAGLSKTNYNASIYFFHITRTKFIIHLVMVSRKMSISEENMAWFNVKVKYIVAYYIASWVYNLRKEKAEVMFVM